MSSYTTHLSTLLALVLIVEFSIGAPLIAESQKRPTDREFGQRDTIHLYPTDVASTDWRSLDNVLIPDNDEDDIYQQFSKREAAYVPLPAELEAEAEADAAAEQNQAIESSTNKNTEPSDSLDAIDESSNTEPASDSTDVEVVPPPQPEPEEQSEPVAEPVNTSPSETEDSSAKESTTAEPTAMLDRAKESMSSFFTVARELFPLAQSGTTTLRSESESDSATDEVITDNESTEELTDQTLSEPVGAPEESSELEVNAGVSTDTENENSSPTEAAKVVDPVPEESLQNSAATSVTETSTSIQEPIDSEISTPPATTSDSEIEVSADAPDMIETAPATTTATSAAERVSDTEAIAPQASVLPDSFSRHRITFSGFSLPELKSGETITSMQLRASLAAQYDLPASTTAPIYEVTFTTPSSSQTVGTVLVEDEVSNALNGGYFLFALPQDIRQEDFKDITVTVEFIGDTEALAGAFLDAIWLEINTHRVTRADLAERTKTAMKDRLKEPSFHERVSDAFDFARDDRLVFNLKYHSQRSRAVESVREFLGQRKIAIEDIKVMHHGEGELGIRPEVTVTKEGLVTIVIPEDQQAKMKPGEYTIEMNIDEGGVELQDGFSFQWGMLSINPDKATGQVDEPVTISMGALTPNGNTVCNADLRLYHVSPSEFISQLPVTQSGLCDGNNVIDVPDYSARVTPAEAGTHELYLERLDESGTVIAHTVTTFITEVRPDLQVVRSGPTRIYPLAPYDMTLEVVADSSFSGTITERVPGDFAIFNTDATVREVGAYKELTWELSMLPGTSESVSYSFDAPDIWPYLFELGPAALTRKAQTVTVETATTSTISEQTSASQADLSSGDFVEHRQWQIASDAAGKIMMLWDDGASIPADWRCVSCTGGDTEFSDRFIIGSSTASTTGGAATHTHTATGNVFPTNDAAVSEGGAVNDISPNSHGHSFTPTISSASNLPSYRDLRLIQYTGTGGEPGTLPAGVIGVFDVASSSLPAGWTRYAAQDGFYVRVADTVGGTGGTDTHTHTVSGSTGAGDGIAERNRGGGTQVGAALLTHTHTVVSTSTISIGVVPPYIEVVLAKLSTDASPPEGLIAMWNGEVGTGWTDVSSDSEAPFNHRFLRASTTYGQTGGTSTHSHIQVSTVTDVPIGTDNARSGGAGASDAHTHDVTVTDFSTENNMPPFVTVVYGKRVGTSPVYEQLSYRWYAEDTDQTPTDPWPIGVSDLLEGEPIDGNTTVVSDGDQLRLRLNTVVTNATATAGTRYKLQYAASDNCTVATGWQTVGNNASSTVWRGYDETPADNSTLSSTVLASSTVAQTYQESGFATGTPNDIGPAAVGEWDFTIEHSGAAAGTNYCFRLVENDGTAFATYTTYPQVLTNRAPNAPTLNTPFDNEKTASTSLDFFFVTTDPESEDVHYQVQIDNNYDFSSTLEDRTSISNSAQFENQVDISDKAPFGSGDLMKFSAVSSFSNGTTYYWRARARDPNGSDEWGDWSTIQSFTIDTALTASAWYQTETEQFDTNTLNGIDTASDQMDLASGSTTGTTTSGAITFSDADSGTAWGRLEVNETDSSDVVDYFIEYRTNDGTWVRVPESDLPGNSTGFASSTSLLTLDVDTYSMIRIVSVFSSNAGTPSIQDWTVTWGFRVETPTISKLFPNEKTGTTTPLFEFTTSDPQNDSLTYQVSWSTEISFTASTTRDSNNDPSGFSNIDDGGDTDPFTSGDTIQYRLQGADALTNGTTYWWRVRAKDTTGDDAWSFWTDPRSFTVDTTVVASTWFQTTQDQFDSNILSGTIARANDTAGVATTATEALIVYGEGTGNIPRYRQWDGSSWGDEGSLLGIDSPLRYAVVRAAPTREEYIAVTSGNDNDVNAQIFTSGDWDDLQEMTTSMGDATARGFDVVYETLSGDALVVYCDGGPNPSYRVWDGSTWSAETSITAASADDCRWLELDADPNSNEIAMVIRDSDGSEYEPFIWNGSTWASSATFGAARNSTYSGISLRYEDTSGDAVSAVPSPGGGPNRMEYNLWNGTTWGGGTTQTIGGRLYWSDIARNVGNDDMVLCYSNEDSDTEAILWDGATDSWSGNFEFTAANNADTDPGFDCIYETTSGSENDILAVYSDTDSTDYRIYTGTWGAASQVNTIGDAATMQLERTGDGTILGAFFDDPNDSLLFSSWDGSSWSSTETLEDDMSVDSSPFGQPYWMAPRNDSTEGTTIVSPGIDFDDGSGPYWEQMSWVDSTPGSSDILYSVQYQTATGSWEFIPDSEIPGNSVGTSTGTIDLSGLNRNTYNVIRPYAALSCDGSGNCPELQDWTVEWAEGITVSGTLDDYTRTTPIDGVTVAVAVNGVVQTGKTDTVTAGVWSISNVTAFPGDIVTVFVDGALPADVPNANEAVGVTRYDGFGDITGFALYERHVALGSDDATSTPLTNTDIALYTSVSDEDVFLDITNGTLDLCSDVGCGDVRLIINASTTYQAGGNLLTHDVINNGTLVATTSLYVSGSWTNAATTTLSGATVFMTATSSTESIDSTGASVSSFNNLTFGTTTGSATWTLATTLDANGDLSVDRGTLARGTTEITVAGDLSTGATGFWTGLATTTFDGATGATWSDQNSTLQNVGNVFIDGTNKLVTLTGNVAANDLTIGSDDTLDVSASNFDLTIYGDWTNNNSFVARSAEVFFAATTTGRQIDVGGDSFYDLSFTGAGGNWSFVESALDVNNDLLIATGSVMLAGATTTVGGSWDTVGGIFMHGNAAIEFDGAGTETIAASTTVLNNAFFDLRFTGSGNWTFLDLTSTTTNNLIIESGTVNFPDTLFSIGGSLLNTGGTFTGGTGEVRLFAGGAASIETGSSAYTDLTIDGSGTFTYVDTTSDINGDLTINNGTLVLPSTLLTIGGSLTNAATIDPNSGTVEFDSLDTGEVIDFGSSALATVVFDSATGGWTITTDATTTGALTLTSGSDLTLSSGQVLSVGGTFTNSIGGASTTWTGSTLSLEAGSYSINTKTDNGDDYETIRIDSTADVKVWNSQATTTTIVSGGSLYSQDHAASDGALYIYGSYERTSGSEYWSFATDWDGTDLTGGSERQANVRFAAGASAAFTDVSFNSLGSTTATTTVANQGAGTYTVSLTRGTTTLQYFDWSDLGSTGLTFAGTTSVDTLANGIFTVGANAGSALTVASTTIDANPATQFFNVNFATTTVISATNVTQTGGAPVSYWWFREGSGNLYGEQFDADTGNPGSVRWDDSALVLTISGTIYSDDGTTLLGGDTCDADVDNPVRVVVGGDDVTGVYDGDCLGDSTYSVSGVTVVGDQPLTIFLNDAPGGEVGTVVTKTATADITDLDIFANRVITRHEDVLPMTIDDMALYDSTNDDDIRFIAATSTVEDTLAVAFDTELRVWASTTFTPGGPVTLNANATGNSYDGSLFLEGDTTFTGAGTTTYTIGGSLTLASGATFVPASTTVLMTATTSGKTITTATGESLQVNELQFTGSGGSWNLNGNATATADILVSAGTLTGTGDLQLINGSFSGNGLVSLGGGEVFIEQSNTLGGTQGWTFNDLVLGNSIDTGTTTPGSSATTTIGGTLTIGTAHFLDAGTSKWLFTGSGDVLVENGTFLYDTSEVIYGGTGAMNIAAIDYYDMSFRASGGSPTYTADGIGLQAFGDVTVGGTSNTTVTLATNDPAFNVDGNFIINSTGTFVASDSGSFTIAGDYENNGAFTSSAGTVTFDGVGTSDIAAGNSSFATLDITGTGDFTISEHATASTFTIGSSANSFTLSSNQTLEVTSTFSNELGGAATTWTDSVLHLTGGGNYEINASTTNDTYDTLRVGDGTHIRMWNSSATTYQTDGTGSLYSMDHAATDGDLYIFGQYEKLSGIDYWSYARDFDGTDLSGGSERTVDVYIEGGDSVFYGGSAELSLIGIASASTTIQHQGGGVYAMTISGNASTTMNYYSFSDLDADGLTFSVTPNVVDLSYGSFLVANNSDSAITVGGTAINASPARNFTQNIFATSSGVTTAVNVTATGTSVSSWRFTNHTGDIAGEAFDSDPDGDPGYLVWDDSAASITVTGTVYDTDESTISNVCAGATIRVRVAGLTTYDTTCNGSGVYSVSGVTYSPGDSIVAYIVGQTENGATVTIDPVSNINNFDIYENRLIVRHEGTEAITIDDISVWDSSDDAGADLFFTAVNSTPDTLTVPADYKLIVWDSKEFAPGGDVTVSGGGAGAAYDGTVELQTGATYTAAPGEILTVGGSLLAGVGATYEPSTATTTFTTTGASRTIDINDGSFYNVEFTGSGSWSVTDTVFTVNNLRQTDGALTLPTGTTTVSGFWNTSAGTFTNNDSLMVFDGTGSGNQLAFSGSDVAELQFTGSGSWNMTDTDATSTSNVTILDGDLTLPSGTFSVAGSFRNEGGSFAHNSGELVLSTSTPATLLVNGSDLNALTFRGGGEYTVVDTSLALLDTLTINTATVTLTTTLATSTLSIGGSLDASSGVIGTATGTILFNSDDTGETIDPGESSFYNVIFSNGSGGWTIVSDATTTRNFTLTTASDFTLQSGATLYVGNVFDNSVGGSATTWDGSTLILDPGAETTLNSKTDAGDDYETLEIGANADIRSWFSQATTTVIDPTSSWYSQDNGDVDGELYIYGDFTIGTTTEFWSYTTDFDGVSLTGSERQVTVRHAAGATTTVNGGTLNIVGESGNETLITNQGAGTYAIFVTDGTFNAQYYQFRNLWTNGLGLSGTPTISSLNYGDFELAVDGGRLIDLSSTTLNANASLVITGARFATTTAISGTNVYLTGETESAWTFTGHTGNLDGEDFDVDGVSNCGQVRWNDSSCQLLQQTHYRWRNDDGGLGAPNTEWFDTDWAARKSVRIDNADATAYTTAVVELTVDYDGDMQVDFDDLRFTDNSGTTTIPHFIASTTNGIAAEVWVRMNDLPANDTGTLYMYYNNPGATTTSSSTLTFNAADDFEDGDIAEYDGANDDKTLFTTDASFGYGSSFGLSNAGNIGERANDGGMAWYDQTISQGETFRYLQFVDTSDGDNEVCTMFGVQSLVDNNQNYAVCTEQVAGTDYISLVRDVVDTPVFSGTELASTTLAGGYTEGWYEVEVDWGTDDSIFVSLYDDAETLIATTSATDSTYTSGGIGFTYWVNDGGWDNLSSRPTLTTEPTVRFGVETTNGGASWATTQDTPLIIAAETNVRLRLAVENSGLSTTTSFTLEYADKGAAPSCEAVSGASFAAVPTQSSCGTEAICMQTSGNFTNGAATADLLTGTEGTAIAGEASEDPSNSTGNITIATGEFTELEYNIVPTSNAASTNYCLRTTGTNGDLDTYLSVAELEIRFDPVVDIVYFDDRDGFTGINLLGGTTTRVYATTSVSDANGFADLEYATATMYSTAAGAACTEDPNNCYIVSNSSSTDAQCSFTNCSGDSCVLECFADFAYHADPAEWYAFVEVEDSQGGVDFDTSMFVEVNELSAIQSQTIIDYGALAAGTTTGQANDTGSFNPTTTIENIGNIALDISLVGTDLTDNGASIIEVDNQLFATSSFTYSSCGLGTCTPLSSSTIPNYEVDLAKPTTTANQVDDLLYWGIQVPFGVRSNPHTGQNTFFPAPD